jgi:antitoxin ParD1/3/4
MESVNIALPEALESFVRSRVSAGGYGSVSEYVGALIREDQKRQAEERIDGLLREALESGEPIEVGPGYWAAKKRDLAAKLATPDGD